MSGVDALLRGERGFAAGRGAVPWAAIAGFVVLYGALSGGVIGSFSLRAEQVAYSALKVPILIAFSTALCAPSFYALNAVLGLRDDFSAALRGVLSTQATVAVVLASLAPIVGLAYVSGASYRGAVLVDGAAFLAASIAGQVALARHYRPLIARDPRHRRARSLWLVLYWFVTIQLAWVLRPFIGAPSMEPSFLREQAWSNAYVEITRAFLGRSFGGFLDGYEQ
jgi:hypothetical protein